MKRVVLSLSLIMLLAASLYGQEMEKKKLFGLGPTREYYIYNPEDKAPGAPLVIVLHGYGGRAEKFPEQMLELARKYHFGLCSPQGLKDKTGKAGWNCRYPSQEGMKTNDVTFLANLAKKLQKQYGYSKDNTFLCGMSNGGDIGYMVAWQRPDVFAAIASVAGLTFNWLIDESYPHGSVPFLEIHGTEDRVSEWMGDPQNAGGWGSYASVPVGIAYMIAANRCKSEECVKFPLKDPEKPSNQVYLHRYYDGINGSEVRLYEVIGGNHSWHFKDFDTCEAIWAFFSQYITDETGAHITSASDGAYADAEVTGTIMKEISRPTVKVTDNAGTSTFETPHVIGSPAAAVLPAKNASSTSLSMADEIIDLASSYLGTPYRYASTGPNSFDCSGFTSYVFKQFGYSLPHSSGEQGKLGRPIALNELRRGDLVLFNGSRIGNSIGHVGIVVDVKYDNSFTFIHAAIQGGVIISDSLEPYYSSRYKGARRILAE